MKKIFYVFLLMLPLAACTASKFDVKSAGEGGDGAGAVVTGEDVTATVEVLLSDELCDLIEEDLARGGRVKTRSDGFNSIQETLDVVSVSRIFNDPEYEDNLRAAGLHKWYSITYRSGRPATRAAGDLLGVEGIESATPARKIKRNAFNDPEYYRQWHYYNDGSLGSVFTKGADINVVPVWEQFTTGNPDVLVSVVDGGIDHNHPDLADNYAGGYNFVRNNSYVTPDNHGTHVAGTIAAVSNNGIGVAGIAGGDAAAGKPGVKLLSSQIFSDDNGRANTADAIVWGANHGAVISQNSWSFDFDDDPAEARRASEAGLAAYSPSLKAAIDYFIDNAGCNPSTGQQLPDSPMRGGVYIAAAGNDNNIYNVIAEYERVIAVASIGPDFSKARYSNYGPWVDICAPGGEANYGSSAMVYSTVPDARYGYLQGTSMACPHVSGVAALIVSYFGGQGFTNTQLRDKLLEGANAEVMKDVNTRTYIGPLVDAFGSFTIGGVTPPDVVANYTVNVKSNNLDFAWNVTSGDDGLKAFGYVIMAAKDPGLLVNPDMENLPEGVVSRRIYTGNIPAGQRMTGRIDDLEFNTTYYTAIAGFNSNNYYSLAVNQDGQVINANTPAVAVNTTGNNPPEVAIKGAGSITLKAHETGELHFTVLEPDEHPFSVSLDTPTGAAALRTDDKGNYTLVINAPTADAGSYEAVVTVTDAYGLSSSITFRFVILENNPPEIIKDIDNILFSRIGERVALDMSEYINDPDGETLRYSVSLSTTTNLSFEQNGNVVEFRATNFGSTTVTLRGADVKSKTCTQTFIVLARDPSIPIDVYPNPVIDKLTVRPYKESPQTRITVLSSTGAKVFDSVQASSPFEPAIVDMGSVAPGKYVINVSFDGESYLRTVVKQ